MTLVLGSGTFFWIRFVKNRKIFNYKSHFAVKNLNQIENIKFY